MDYVDVAKTFVKTPYYLYKTGKYIYNNMPRTHLRKRKHNKIPQYGRKKPRTGFKSTKQGMQRGVMGGQKTIQPALGPGRISFGKTLTIGKSRPMSTRDKILSVSKPPQFFNSKWTFQMDCASGRVTAATIPILNKNLLDPIYAQLFSNAMTDTTTVDASISTNPTLQYNYSIKISDYKSNYKFYNSSSQSATCRLVWYKPKTNLTGIITFPNTDTSPSGPLNVLMKASNACQPQITVGIVAPVVGDGVQFDAATPGYNWTSNFEHAGWPITGASTTAGSLSNTVAYLDQSLVPGSPQVRKVFNQYWTELKSEDFIIEPGHQHNCSLRMKNRVVKTGADDTSIQYYKNGSVVGILYVIGQIVFNDGTDLGAPVTTSAAISTGSSQISVLREDTCRMQPLVTKKSYRLNLTSAYQVFTPAAQAQINVETDDADNEYTADGF